MLKFANYRDCECSYEGSCRLSIKILTFVKLDKNADCEMALFCQKKVNFDLF